ncbi:MAG: hypothetical protein ACTSXG_01290, partial [Alphaproteobacteria bacterium]
MKKVLTWFLILVFWFNACGLQMAFAMDYEDDVAKFKAFRESSSRNINMDVKTTKIQNTTMSDGEDSDYDSTDASSIGSVDRGGLNVRFSNWQGKTLFEH